MTYKIKYNAFSRLQVVDGKVQQYQRQGEFDVDSDSTTTEKYAYEMALAKAKQLDDNIISVRDVEIIKL